MSLGCFECKRDGAFNTVIIFDPTGDFDTDKLIYHYSNFYVCHDCAAFYNFVAVKKSRFMIVEERNYQDCWLTGNDGDKIKETKFKFIDEDELRKRLPEIFKGLSETKFQRMVVYFTNIHLGHRKLLARKMGASFVTVDRWKDGKSEPHPKLRLRVEEFIRNHKCKCK